jgi:DNA-binding MarR family transcriptional regulator
VNGAPSVSPPSSATPAEDGGDAVRVLTERLMRLVRLTQVARSRAGTSPGHERDRAAYLVLQAVERLGPVRQRALAEALRADASTLSRQVTFLVERGLLRRTADVHDGRACLLELTPEGGFLTDALRGRREHLVSRLLAGWTPSERTAFTELFGRLVDELADLVDGLPARTAWTELPASARDLVSNQ